MHVRRGRRRPDRGPSTKTDEMSFLAADTNGDGLVDEAELAADQAKRFKQLDANGDGFLTPDELDTHTAAIFAAIDRNGDGNRPSSR